MRQRWNDLLFAHWPIPPAEIAALLPPGLVVDTYAGDAWIGVVPFWMDRVQIRVAGDQTGGVPTTRTFSELNLRTYVRSARTGKQGVFFFSLDCSSPLAVAGARMIFHLPYYCASIQLHQQAERVRYESRRWGRGNPAFQADYHPCGPIALSKPGSLEAFLTERYCLFTPHGGSLLRGEIHHAPWPLQPAQAEIGVNELPAAHGVTLPASKPLLHFSHHLDVYLWSLRDDV
jgi:uncharacterized protein YqjF (DUF2071 family)